MIFGNLESVFEGDRTINEALQNSMNNNNIKKPNTISKILRTLSHYGMNYSDKVYKNMIAIPADKALQPKDPLIQQSLYGTAGYMNNWKVKPEEEKPFNEKTLDQKREILRKLASQPELEDIIEIMSNECIVYNDDETYICTPFLDTALIQELNEKSAEEINSSIEASFYKMYMLLDWKRNAWNVFKKYLIEGVLAYEITYDNLECPKSIIGITDIDPATLTKSIEDGVTYWIQFKGVMGQERKLLDAQVIYIKYDDNGSTQRQSYLERLIRAFNIYRIVEQAQIIWTVTQASFKTVFTIPVGGMNKARGAQTLREAMQRYKEDIAFNTDTGEIMVNGKMNLPFNKEYWMPENEQGTPQIETLVDQGPMLNDSDQLKYFKDNLYFMSKIPTSRFDKEQQATWFGSDPTQQLREEINFGRFVARLRNSFADIILKPIRIQLTLSIPDIKNDKRILDAVSLRWNSYNQFEEMANIEIMSKRVEFIGTMKDSLVITNEEGEEESYFSPKFLIIKYLKMSEADLELNEKYKEEERLAKEKAGGDTGSDEGEDEDKEELKDELTGKDEEGGGESDEGSDIDDEMLGDVQPESTETTQA